MRSAGSPPVCDAAGAAWKRKCLCLHAQRARGSKISRRDTNAEDLRGVCLAREYRKTSFMNRLRRVLVFYEDRYESFVLEIPALMMPALILMRSPGESLASAPQRGAEPQKRPPCGPSTDTRPRRTRNCTRSSVPARARRAVPPRGRRWPAHMAGVMT